MSTSTKLTNSTVHVSPCVNRSGVGFGILTQTGSGNPTFLDSVDITIASSSAESSALKADSPSNGLGFQVHNSQLTV